MPEFTQHTVEAVMKAMDKELLKGDVNVWRDACEIARYNIAHNIVMAALESVEAENNALDI